MSSYNLSYGTIADVWGGAMSRLDIIDKIGRPLALRFYTPNGEDPKPVKRYSWAEQCVVDTYVYVVAGGAMLAVLKGGEWYDYKWYDSYAKMLDEWRTV